MSKSIMPMIVALLAFMLGGCLTSAPQKPGNQAHDRVIGLNERALAYFERGNQLEATALLKDALRLSESWDDPHGQTLTLINLSRVYRQGGSPNLAMPEIVRGVALSSRNSFAADAAQEMALVELDLGNIEKARVWAGKSLKLEDGRFKGRRLNLLARIAMLSSGYDEAARLAEQALPLNRSAGLAEEEANSSRLLGMAHLKLGKLEEAERHLAAALALDKSSGRPTRIADDLSGLADLETLKGNLSAARDYRERAEKARKSIMTPRQPQDPPKARSH